MAFLTAIEIFDIFVIAIALGFIFMKFIKRPEVKNWMDRYKKRKFNWKDLWYSSMIVAPAVILHEFGHKFVAMGFGLQATFQAAYMWLGLGIILRLVNFSFIFFVPAYVSITGTATHAQYALTAFAGPAVNLLLWLISFLVVKYSKNLKPNTRYAWIMSRRINLLLFIFNMLPIPFFDGWHVYSHIFQMF